MVERSGLSFEEVGVGRRFKGSVDKVRVSEHEDRVRIALRTE